MTMHSEYVRQGAAATRRASTKNPMEILSKLRAMDVTESFERQFHKWRKIVERDDEILSAALLYAFRNYWTALDRDERRPPQQRRLSAEEAQNLKKRFESFVFMKMVLPICGKTLEAATFADCRKEGGWLSKVGKLGNPSEIVGKKLTEEKLRAIR